VLGASDAHSIAYSPAGRGLAIARLSLRQNILAYAARAARPIPIGDGRPVTHGNQVIETHDVSPDGRWIVYDNNLGGNANIYKAPLAGGEPVQLTSESGDEMGPRWSPDGTEIAFYGGLGSIFVVPADGGTAARLTAGRGSGVAPLWSPDGLQIAFLPSGFGPRAPRFMSREHVGGPWSEPVEVNDVKCMLGDWVPDGSGVLCDEGPSVVSPKGRVVGRHDLLASHRLRALNFPGRFSRDGATFYINATHEDGRRGIWAVPLRGGTPRLAVSDDDPARTVYGAISIGPDQLYLTVSEYESDIWVMNLRY
jgi:dipeptidyl aminopeptidase/acylaminoacyl peptidase